MTIFVMLNETNEIKNSLLIKILKFDEKSRPKLKWMRRENTLESPLYELTMNTFKSGIFLLNLKQIEWLKILTSKQVLQRLSITLVQVNTSEKLVNEIRQVIYSLSRTKEITIEVYNNMINSINL